MDKLITSFIFFVLVINSVLCYTTNRTDGRTAICGGKYATPGEFPHHILLYLDGSYLCGGTLVTYDKVVTAGHCLDSYFEAPVFHELSVLAGTVQMDRGERRSVINVYRHPNYTYILGRPYNDVGVLKLSVPYRQTPYIRTIPLATRIYRLNEYAIASGFGRIGHNQPLSTNLKRYTTQIVRSSVCNAYHANRVRKGDLCTYTEYGVGTCKGDSGGPLISNGELIGIVSWGKSCAVGKPDVFTSVYDYKKIILWMLNQI